MTLAGSICIHGCRCQLLASPATRLVRRYALASAGLEGIPSCPALQRASFGALLKDRQKRRYRLSYSAGQRRSRV